MNSFKIFCVALLISIFIRHGIAGDEGVHAWFIGRCVGIEQVTVNPGEHRGARNFIIAKIQLGVDAKAISLPEGSLSAVIVGSYWTSAQPHNALLAPKSVETAEFGFPDMPKVGHVYAWNVRKISQADRFRVQGREDIFTLTSPTDNRFEKGYEIKCDDANSGLIVVSSLAGAKRMPFEEFNALLGGIIPVYSPKK
jgi:hypothetical protein